MPGADVKRTIDAVWRIESARLIAGLARFVRDVGLAEDLAKEARPVSRSRGKRPKEAKRRRDGELWSEMRANRAYEHYRSGRMKDGRRFSRPPDPYTPPATPQGQINLTDPDSHVVKGSRGRGFLQGYNAQAVANEHQIVIAAEVMTVAPDFGHLEPMLDAAQREHVVLVPLRRGARLPRGTRARDAGQDGRARGRRSAAAEPSARAARDNAHSVKRRGGARGR